MNTQLIKLLVAVFVLQLLPFCADAQIFQTKYQKALKEAQKKANENIRGGADFVLDPIESVPKDQKRTLSATAQTNWGKDLLLTPELEARLKSECKYKVTVKVYDTGQPVHASLNRGQLQGTNYTTSTNAIDAQGHSTHVTGIICAAELGICYPLVEMGLLQHKAVKILGDNGSGSFDWVSRAVAGERTDDQLRLSKGEFVVCNGSFGGGTSLVSAVEAELKKSTDIGVAFLFAAGNTGAAGVNYPGNGKYSIACASLDQGLTRSSYSTTGVEVWAAMPGRGILSTYLNNSWATLSGTSMATPFLTGVTAIAYSKWGNKLKTKGLSGLRSYIAWCAKDIDVAGKDNNTGWGLELIQNVLDKDPDNTPGLPPTDPNPPAPPSGNVSISPLPVLLNKEYTVLWDNLQGSAATKSKEAKTFKTAGRGSRKENQGLALKAIKVQFEISVKSTKDTETTSKELEKAVAAYLTNRGFLLLAGQDESHAAYWAAYFLEMGLSTINGIDCDVSKVSFKTSDGHTIGITALKRWPLR